MRILVPCLHGLLPGGPAPQPSRGFSTWPSTRRREGKGKALWGQEVVLLSPQAGVEACAEILTLRGRPEVSGGSDPRPPEVWKPAHSGAHTPGHTLWGTNSGGNARRARQALPPKPGQANLSISFLRDQPASLEGRPRRKSESNSRNTGRHRKGSPWLRWSAQY